MSVEFVAGRPGAQAARYVNERIGAMLREDPFARIEVITPRQSTFEIAGEIVRVNSLAGTLTLDVVSPQNFVGQILEQVYGAGIDPVDTAGKSMAIRRILDDNRDSLHAFARLGGGHQLPSLIAKQVSDLHTMDVGAEELLQYAAETANQRLADLAVIYEALPRALRMDAGERIDAEDRMDMAIAHLGEADLVRSARAVVFRGFSSYSSQMIRLIEAVMRTAQETIVLFPMAPDGAPDAHIYEASRQAMRRLTPAAVPHKLEVIRLDNEQDAHAPEDILHVSRALFSHTGSVRKLQSAPSMQIGSAQDAEQEIRAAAARVAQLNRDEGIPFSRMAIVWGASAGAVYEPLVRRVFGDANIPYFTDEQKTLAQSNLAEFILTAAEMTSGALKKDAVLAHVATGFTPLSPNEQSALLNYAQTRVARGGEFLKQFRRDDPRDFRDDFDMAERARKQVTEPIIKYLRARLKDGSVKDAGEVFGAVEDYLSAVLKAELIEDKAARLGARYEQASFLEQSYKSARQIVRQARDMLRGTKLAAGEARRILQAGFEAVSLSVVPAGVDEVQAGPLGGFHVPPVDALFVVGVNDEVLPKFMEVPKDILTPREWSDMLRELKGVSVPSSSEEQKYQIVEAVRQAKKYIQWSYNTEAGQKPSVLLQYLDGIFVEEVARADLSEQALFLKQNAYDFTVRQIRSRADGIPVRVDRRIGLGVLGDPEFRGRTKTLRASLSTVNEAIAAPPVSMPGALSATRLATFYKCPYQHFVRYQLGAWTPEEPDITTAASGRYMHGVLNRISQRVREEASGPARWSDIGESVFDEIVHEALAVEASEQLGEELYPRTRAVLKVLQPEIVRAAGMLRGQYAAGALHSVASEEAFRVLGGRLSGIIDRIDRAVLDGKTYYSIVDYKSSPHDFSLEDVLSGTDMQLAVYLLALEELIRTGRLDAGRLAGAGFLNTMLGYGTPDTEWWKEYRMQGLLAVPADTALRLYGAGDGSGGLTGAKVRVTKTGDYYGQDTRRIYLPGDAGTPGDLEALIEYTKTRIEEGHTAIARGVNDILPYRSKTATACAYCEYRSICGFDEQQPGTKVRRLDLGDGDGREALRHASGSVQAEKTQTAGGVR